MKPVILDTNVFIAAAFNPRSSSAKIIQAIRDGSLSLVWDESIKSEIKKMLTQIPHTSWGDFSSLFQEANKHNTKTSPDHFVAIEDPDDRKFAALAKDTGATLVTNDVHLLGTKSQTGLDVISPNDFAKESLS
ncbi:MAG: putative toxin-antitoxin system toxin component, family [Candidatus Saccharibacteria bacterium]|nr:putative toxin-antitoxin system toxin component, family [Candidatus Saccharibacteria bacterium]